MASEFEDCRSKHRWGDSKLVYMRKSHGKGPKTNLTQITTVGAPQGHREMGNQMDSGTGKTDGAEIAASDGSTSLSRKQMSLNPIDDHVTQKEKDIFSPTGAGALGNKDARITIRLDGYSKHETWELRRKLSDELELVRGIFKKIEAREVQLRGCSFSTGAITSYSASGNDVRNNGGKEVNSEVASGGVITPKEGQRESKSKPRLNIPVMRNSQFACDMAEKGKRTPKANQYYKNSEFVLGKDKFPPAGSKKSKSGGSKKIAQSRLYGLEAIQPGNNLSSQKLPTEVLKRCSLLLAKMMNHKYGWVFSSPVDAEALGLHDYHNIIEKPMDLGTVKSKLEKNLYESPTVFAEDIRLTFNNAITYNPEGNDVHILARQQLQSFEDRWKSIYAEHIEDKVSSRFGGGQTPQERCHVNHFPLQDGRKNVTKLENVGEPCPANLKPISYPANRIPSSKKPKAKDPHKRVMTYGEKRKLSGNLQNLPADRLQLIVQIIRKRNPSLCLQDEEIEVDIDTFDTETLWELDRFVTNYKKSLSKNKKKALLAQQAKNAFEHGSARDKSATTEAEPTKKNENDQEVEEIEVCDNMPPSNSPPVEIENDGIGASRSSSSSGSSSDSGSSSSDSDSGSSSESATDAYASHSPCSGSKSMPQS